MTRTWCYNTMLNCKVYLVHYLYPSKREHALSDNLKYLSKHEHVFHSYHWLQEHCNGGLYVVTWSSCFVLFIKILTVDVCFVLKYLNVRFNCMRLSHITFWYFWEYKADESYYVAWEYKADESYYVAGWEVGVGVKRIVSAK